MATSVTSYVEVMDERNAPSPKYFTAPNTWLAMKMMQATGYVTAFNTINCQFPNGQWKTIQPGAPSVLFNEPVKMSDNELHAVCMFSSFTMGNIPLYNNGTASLQTQWSSEFALFNSEVVIGKNVTSCYHMFYRALSYNQPTFIPDKVTNCEEMFYEVPSFNQPVVIGNNVINCQSMFFNTPMNADVTIGKNVNNCYRMFCQSGGLANRDVYIPASVNNMVDMFRNVAVRPKNIYINMKGRTGSSFNLCGMLQDSGKTTITTVNVFCSNLALINGSYSNYRNALFNTSMAYQNIVNGMADTGSSVYLYYNYNG